MDPTLPDALKVVALEWRKAAPDLAAWAMRRLVNRRDQWLQFGPAARGADRPYTAFTLPARSRRGVDTVSVDKLERHFGSFRRQEIIGLHAVSKGGTCRWLAVDLDLHKPEDPGADALRAANWSAAEAWWARLEDDGAAPLLLDSNGIGGYHLFVLFPSPVPVDEAHALGRDLTDDWADHGLLRRPELYPKSPDAAASGGALRLPGLHHFRDHITRVYSGERDPDLRWLSGGAATEALLRAQGTCVPAPRRTPPRPPSAPDRVPAGEGPPADPDRPPVLVDLDGVLARYDGWNGATRLGAPIPGAQAFLDELRRRGPVHLFSARLATYDEETHREIEAWLAHHGLEVDRIVWGKPPALAVIDDRAVPCRPQAHGAAAFEAALRRLDDLRSGRPADGDLVRLLDAWPGLSAVQRHRIASAAAEGGAAPDRPDAHA